MRMERVTISVVRKCILPVAKRTGGSLLDAAIRGIGQLLVGSKS